MGIAKWCCLVFSIFGIFLTSVKGSAQDAQPQLLQDSWSQVGFVAEKGQFKTFDNLLFQWHGKNLHAFLLTDRVVFITQEVEYVKNEKSVAAQQRGDDNLVKKLSAVTRARRFDLVFIQSNPEVIATGEAVQDFTVDYYLGHCPQGILNAPSYKKIRYHNLFPDVDMVFTLEADRLKYEFQVKSGGDPSKINYRWEGVNNLHLNENQEMQFSVGSFDFTDKAPVSFCEGKEIATKYILEGNDIRFAVSGYNENETLVIDPALYWASSLQYNGYGSWGALVTNTAGEYYVVDWEWDPGSADVSSYLASAGSSILYSSDVSANDIIISKFSKSGRLTWACRYGGTGDDDVNGGVALDDNNNLFIAGTSQKEFSAPSGDFPLQSWGSFNLPWNGTCGGTRGYLLKFLPDNTRQWATYLDNGTNLEVFDIACGLNNDIYLAGKSGGSLSCTGIPVPSGTGYLGNYTDINTSHNFILRFNNAGALTWSTWCPGTTNSTGRISDIAVDKSNGDVFLVGDDLWNTTYTFSAALISSAMTWMGSDDMFYMKFNASNNPVPAYGRYIGGAGFDKINVGAANGDIELDAGGNLYVCGHTYSANFPLVYPGGCTYYDPIINDGSGIVGNEASTQDGYLFKVSPAGTLSYSTFFGGTGYTSMKQLKKDSHNNLWICGQQTPAGIAPVNHADYFNQALTGSAANVMFAQLGNSDQLEWLSYYGFTGHSEYNGFDIFEPAADSCYLFLTGNFNNSPSNVTNAGGGYQFSSLSCSGAAQFRHYLSASSPITLSGATTICVGSTANWTASSPGGTWSSNNPAVASVNASGVVSGVSAGTCSITYIVGGGCVSRTVTVTSSAPVSASITASPAGAICFGTNVTFTATPVNGGGSPSYQWYLNGSPVGSNSSTYSNAGLSNGNTVYCVVTSNLGCVTNNPAASNTITMTINSANVTFTTPANISVGNDPGMCNAVVNYVTPTASTTTNTNTPQTQTFNYSGSIVNWTVPADVTSLTITAKGAQGASNSGTGGSGAIMTGIFNVTPGQVLSILVGQQPSGGNYAAGGGGSFVALGAAYASATPLIVAGGGGGANSGTGGDASTGTSGMGPTAGAGGNGATATSCGGGGGGFYSSGGNDFLTSANFISYGAAGFRQGGAGGTASGYQSGGFGGGAAANYYGACNMTGGAGGGYSGGSGLNSGTFQAAGYGGGSYNGGSSQSNSVGNTGHGQVVINYNIISSTTVAATVTQTSGLASGSTFPAGTTTNVFSATGGNGCLATTSFTVTVNAAPSVAPTSITGTTTVCSGTSTTLTVSGGSLGTGASWMWYSGSCGGTYVGTGASITVSPASNTSYFVRAVGPCNTTTCASTLVTVVDMNSVLGGSMSASSTSLCEGQSVTITNTTWGGGAVAYWASTEGGYPCSWDVFSGAYSGQSSFTFTPPANPNTSACEGDPYRIYIYCATYNAVCGWNWGTGNGIAIWVYPYPVGGSISGNANPCPYSTNTYTATGVTNVNSYTWSVPAGATINSGQGTASISVTFGATRGNVTCTPANYGCGGTPFSLYINIDPTSPTYVGTTVSNANYQSGSTYFVKNGSVCFVTIHHTDNCSSNTQYLEFTQQPTNSFGNWGLPNIKSSAKPYGVAQTGFFTSFGDGPADNTQLDIQNAQCVSAGNCNADVNGKWQIVGGAGPSTNYHITVFMYDQMGQGVGYTNSGLDLWLDNTNPSTPGTPYITSGANTNSQTWATSGSTDGESGVNGSGYEWQWSYDNANWNAWFTGGTTGSGTWGCNQTVYIRVRAVDNVVNIGAWSASGSASAGISSTAPSSISGTTTICNGSSTTITALGGMDGTGASYQWYAGGCGAGGVLGTGASLSVSPASTTTYYVRRTGSCNTTACASQLVTVNTLSVAPTSISGITTVCTGLSTTLTSVGGSGGTGSTLNWYTGDCGGIFTQEWFSQPYGTGQTTVNSVSASGILNVSSTSNDPMIFMSALGSFNPAVYKYIQIRYRVTAGTAGSAEIFFYNTVHNFAVGGESASGALISDGLWHILNIDMSSDPDYTTGGNIVGWRYDWCGAGGVTMELDYIKLAAGLAIGQGPSVTVSPAVSTTYYVMQSGICNTTSCASQLVTISAPSSTTPISILNGDYVWSGNTNTDWHTPSNWLVYNGSLFSTAVALPTVSNNVFIRGYGGCATNAPLISAGNGYCNDITIENGRTLSMSTARILYIAGDWRNDGSFAPGNGTVAFYGPVNSTSTIYPSGTGPGKQFFNLSVNSASNTGAGTNDGNKVDLYSDIQINNDFILTSGYQFNVNNSSNMTIAGNFTHNICEFNRGTGSVTLTGASKLIDGAAATYFRILNISGSYTLTEPSIYLWSNPPGDYGDLNILAGGSLNATSKTIHIDGNWTNNGTFTAGTGTVSFERAYEQFVFSGGSRFYNFTVNRTATPPYVTITDPAWITNYGNFVYGVVNYNGTGSLNFTDNATSNGGAVQSFVDGPVIKTGNENFLFPVGDLTSIAPWQPHVWAPLGITNAAGTATDQFTCEYFFTAAPNNYNAWNMCDYTQLHHASGIEYWNLDRNAGASLPNVTLYWKNADRSGISNVADVVVAHYEPCPLPSDPSRWKAMATSAAGTTGPGGTGSAIGSGFTGYSPVTFGTKTNSNPLPVSLLDFKAVCNGGGVEVHWSTATETNNDYFIVERSLDASSWQTVITLQGAGNSNSPLHYQVLDAQPYNGTSFYRLSQVDYNGLSETFNAVAVRCNEGQPSVSFYPNPFTSGLTIELVNMGSEKASVTIYDILGQKVLARNLVNNELVNGILTLDLGMLARGLYTIEFRSDSYSRMAKILKD